MVEQIKTQGVLLKRMHSKLGECITWSVHSLDGKYYLGVVRQLNDHYRIKHVGWQRFPEKFWLASRM